MRTPFDRQPWVFKSRFGDALKMMRTPFDSILRTIKAFFEYKPLPGGPPPGIHSPTAGAIWNGECYLTTREWYLAEAQRLRALAADCVANAELLDRLQTGVSGKTAPDGGEQSES